MSQFCKKKKKKKKKKKITKKKKRLHCLVKQLEDYFQTCMIISPKGALVNMTPFSRPVVDFVHHHSVQIIFHFLWAHWAHCRILENGVLLMYTLEGVGSDAI